MSFSLLHSIHMADSGTFSDGSEFDGLNKREGNFTSKFCQIHDFSSMRAVLYDLVGFVGYQTKVIVVFFFSSPLLYAVLFLCCFLSMCEQEIRVHSEWHLNNVSPSPDYKPLFSFILVWSLEQRV